MSSTVAPQGHHVQLPRSVDPSQVQFFGRFFATTDAAVFSTRGLLKGAAPETFQLIAESDEARPGDRFLSAYAVSGSDAYFVDQLSAPKRFAVAGNVRLLAPHYVTDGKQVFHDGSRLAGAKPDTLRVLSWCYAIDAASCYHLNKKIAGARPDTFRLLAETPDDWNEYYAADAASAYYYATRVPDAIGAQARLRRDARGYVLGLTDGVRDWTPKELAAVLRAANRPASRAVMFAAEAGNVAYHDNLFAGLEERLSIFLMLCSHRSIESFEAFTRGQVGEPAVLRAIEHLNQRAPAPLAEVDAKTIRITPAGMAAYRQFGPVVDAIAGLLGTRKP